MKPGSEILASCADRIVWVRVEGNGSSTNSTALRDFAKEMIHRGAREFIVDLCNCPVMDSTFMGTLAGISLWLGELGEGCLSVVNLNERNAESLCSLGLDQLFNVRVSAIKKDGQALPITSSIHAILSSPRNSYGSTYSALKALPWKKHDPFTRARSSSWTWVVS